MRTERAEPILPSRDLEETRQFYQRLGFEAWWGGKAPWDYEIVSRGNLVMHFFLESSLAPETNETSCYWRVADAGQLHAELSALQLPLRGIPRLTAPIDQPWGMHEFTIVDPSGNLLRVGHETRATCPGRCSGPARNPGTSAGRRERFRRRCARRHDDRRLGTDGPQRAGAGGEGAVRGVRSPHPRRAAGLVRPADLLRQ